MNEGFPKYTSNSKTGNLGVHIVSNIISNNFGWLFKTNHQEHDFGIDGQVEYVLTDGSVTGQMFAVQIKCGKTFFLEKNRWGFIYKGSKKHFNYYSNYPIPVVICICDPETKECYWSEFKIDEVKMNESSWQITIPFKNILDSSKERLKAMFINTEDHLSELEAYWAMNNMIQNSSIVHVVLGKEDIENMDISNPIDFMKRLLSNKELAYECKNKIEITFFGYDEDYRELFEIEEVRNFISYLDSYIPGLFFFAYKEPLASTIITFALCQSKVELISGRAKTGDINRVILDTENLGPFFDRHFASLNMITEWLEMSDEENAQICSSVVRCFGFDIDTGGFDEGVIVDNGKKELE